MPALCSRAALWLTCWVLALAPAAALADDGAAPAEPARAPAAEPDRAVGDAETLAPAEVAKANAADEGSDVELDAPAAPAPRLVDRATAELHVAYAIAGASHRGEPLLVAELPLGALAAVGGGIEDRLLVGEAVDEAEPVRDYVMWFRVGAPQGSWFRHQPALSVTFERAMGERAERAAEVRGTATDRWTSTRAGALQATAGVGVWELAAPAERLSQRPLRERVRPFGGLAWTPPSYPNTSILMEGSFGPTVLAGRPRLDWRLGWGARYRVYSWVSVDLVVRNRQDAGLGGSTVMVRLCADAV